MDTTELERNTELKIKSLLESYDIDYYNGCLRSSIPLRSIPIDKYPQYKIWEDIMKELPELLISQSFGKKIKISMPIINDISDLLSSNIHIKRRALTILSFFANAFINETQIIFYPQNISSPAPRNYLPECISIPLYALCIDMKVPPVIRHCNLTLNNYRLLFNNNKHTARYKVDNLALNNLFLGGIDENWFFLIATGIESHGGIIFRSILFIQEYIKIFKNNNNNIKFIINEIKKYLTILTQEIICIKKLLLRYYEKLDATTFYLRVRIFLNGCDSLNDFPNGVELRGINKKCIAPIGSTPVENKESDNLCIRFSGASAAQCAVFPVIDNFFRIYHTKDTFLDNMKYYMPVEHREFITFMKKRLNFGDCLNILKQSGCNQNDIKEIQSIYKGCIDKLREFRTVHMKIAADFIVQPSRKLKQNSKGTGGSSVLPYLQSVRDRTHELNDNELKKTKNEKQEISKKDVKRQTNKFVIDRVIGVTLMIGGVILFIGGIASAYYHTETKKNR